MAHYIFRFALEKCALTFEYLVLKWTWPLPFKSFHSQKIAGQLGWEKIERIKTAYFQADGLWAFQHITFFFSRLAPGLSVSLSRLHVFIHRLWGSCTSPTQCTNIRPAEQGFRGDFFFSSTCAGLSYIHGNQPVHFKRPVGQESIKLRNGTHYESAVEVREGLSGEKPWNHSKTVWDH